MAKTDTPPERLHDFLRYSPETGLFHWKVRRHKYGGMIMPGDVAGAPKDGYVNIGLHGTLYRAHRLAWYMMTGDWLPPKQDIDHINGVRNDNRWSNLRLATRSQNQQNACHYRSNKSGFRGVSFRKDTGKWHARITVNRRIILLGNYDTVDAAGAARAKAELQHFGDRSFLKREG